MLAALVLSLKLCTKSCTGCLHRSRIGGYLKILLNLNNIVLTRHVAGGGDQEKHALLKDEVRIFIEWRYLLLMTNKLRVHQTCFNLFPLVNSSMVRTSLAQTR